MIKETDTFLSIYEEIYKSGFFDEDFYLELYDDVRNADFDPLEHYIKYGQKEGRKPSETFDEVKYTDYFKGKNEDLSFPFLHFVRNSGGFPYTDKGLLSEFSFPAIQKINEYIKNTPFFSESEYENMNSDIKNSKIPAHIHATIYGISEGRQIFSSNEIASVFGVLAKEKPSYSPSKKTPRVSNKTKNYNVVIFYHSKGNCFIKEIAEDLRDYIQATGLNSIAVTEDYTPRKKPDLYIFCAPHEFFFLSGSEKWKKEDIIANSVMLNTEQPQTNWFNRGIIYLFMSKGVIDFSYQNCSIFSDMGIKTFHFDPIVSSNPTEIISKDTENNFYKILPDSAKKTSNIVKPFFDRAIDVSFFGNDSKRRDKFLSRNAEYFSSKECFFYYRKSQGPITNEGPSEILSRIPSYVADNSKIVLNIHRDEDPYFEWHRIVKQGLARGAVVVSEECLPHPLYKEGVHFLVETPRHMPNLIDWLLFSKEGNKKSENIQKENLSLLQNSEIIKYKNNDLLSFILDVK